MSLLARRLAGIVPLLLIVSLVVFCLSLLIPGDPAVAVLGQNATDEQLAAVRAELGLDQPVLVRYVSWLGDVVQGDFGSSLFTGYPVKSALADRFAVTASLVGLGVVVSVIIGVCLGAVAGYRKGSAFDRIAMTGASAGVAIPNFWLGAMFILVFGIKFEWLPATGYEPLSSGLWQWASHLVLPVVALASSGAAEIARQMRASMADTVDADFIRTVRAKGMGELSVALKHGLKNAMVPVVTVAGMLITRIFGASIVIEQVFDMKGIGSLSVEAVQKRDVPVLQGIVLIVTVAVVLCNTAVDMSYSYFRPQIRMTEGAS
ncbi:MAG TPA: ABC transporter permease [Ilumatobacter sp.]|nr:ABC transporter permease [Ilumatobacter sp.]